MVSVTSAIDGTTLLETIDVVKVGTNGHGHGHAAQDRFAKNDIAVVIITLTYINIFLWAAALGKQMPFGVCQTRLAQLVERTAFNRVVMGSSPMPGAFLLQPCTRTWRLVVVVVVVVMAVVVFVLVLVFVRRVRSVRLFAWHAFVVALFAKSNDSVRRNAVVQ